MISVLMPIYNGIEFIEDSVNSILNQTYNNWELIIGVNGHPEKSDVYEVAKKYENTYGSTKIRVFDLYMIKGKSSTLNFMLRYCNNNYIALLDVDDIWYPNKLEIQTKYLNEFDIVGSNCVWFGEKNGVIPSIPIGDISEFNFKQVNPIINSSSIIRKGLCYWNNNDLEDYDLWLRLRNLGRKFYNCEEILVKHRIHQTSAFNANGNHLKVAELLAKH
jgi:glycosyltransferase involved in cell wall biosynthesis